jgi:hypothetical protein
MDIWTHGEGGTWRRWNHVGLGLDAVARANPRVDQVLVVGSDPADDEPLAAMDECPHWRGGPCG